MKRLVTKTMFEAPGWSLFLNAHFLPRRALWNAMRQVSGDMTGVVVDIGCGKQPYRDLLTSAELVVGLEVGAPSRGRGKVVDVFYDGRRLPFADGQIDCVLCNQVLEHVFEPHLFLQEVHRVLKANGQLVLSVPFVWPEHEQPADSQRFTSFGIGFRLESDGFEVVRSRKLVNGVAALCALIADSVNSTVRALPMPLRVAARMLIISPLSFVGLLADSFGLKDSALYLDNFVIARKQSK